MTLRSRFLFALSLLLFAASTSRAQDLFELMNNSRVDDIAKALKADPKLANKPGAYGELPLHYALRGDNRQVIDLLLGAGADVNAFNGNGFTPLQCAAGHHKKAVIEALLAKGAKIDVPSKDAAVTPLFFAARGGNKPVVALLVNKGAAIEGGFNAKVSAPPWTPLYEAVGSGQLATAEFLLLKGANPNAKGPHGNPLDKAAENKDLDMIHLLLAHGADVHSQDAFTNALQSGQRDLVELFLNRGIDAKKPFYLAVAASVSKDLVALLLERGADPRILDPQGRSALMLATMKGDTATMALLLARGAPVKHVEDGQMTALHYAASATAVELLLASGAEVDAAPKEGLTPLLCAVKAGKKEVAEALVKRGAKLDVFSMAALGRAEDLRKALGNGAIPKPLNPYHSPALHLAALFGHNDTAAVLLDKGAAVNSKDGRDQTPLHVAAAHGHKATVEFLLKKGADINAKSLANSFSQKGGETPLQMALASGQVEVVRLLLDKGATPQLDKAALKLWWRNACSSGQLPMFRYFIEQGPARDAGTLLTPLLIGAEQGDLEFVKFVVAKGADVKKVDSSANSALRAAARGNRQAVVEYLLAQGADAKEELALSEAVCKGHIDIVELLLSKGANVQQTNGPDWGGLLRQAVAANRLDMVKLLLAKGADPKQDKLLLHFAAASGQRPLIETLLAAGVDLNGESVHGFFLYYYQFEKRREVLDFFQKTEPHKPPPEELNNVQTGTPLHAAVAFKRQEAVELLLAKGAKIDTKLPNGSTVLHLAAFLGDVDMVKLLLANKADSNAKDAIGETALQLAEREGRNEIVELLQKARAKK